MTEQTMTMTNEEITRAALSAFDSQPHELILPPVAISYMKRHMSLDKKKSGWVVTFKLNVPEGWEPNLLQVEVYEEDGSTHIPKLL